MVHAAGPAMRRRSRKRGHRQSEQGLSLEESLACAGNALMQFPTEIQPASPTQSSYPQVEDHFLFHPIRHALAQFPASRHSMRSTLQRLIGQRCVGGCLGRTFPQVAEWCWLLVFQPNGVLVSTNRSALCSAQQESSRLHWATHDLQPHPVCPVADSVG
ncbi:troponin T, cardiac muscle [Platysternon megacephalum]|uniref:Troponin T, cardiac muscle n=1 Tax=Platysternon megacephalum TaxID=55544 RepID=A0A4D9E4P5_9SAUR|nr:troponin T, cardiac muscle [Platysternon megacephalum]